MDLAPIVFGIVAANLGTLLAGTALAIHRARHEHHVDPGVSRGRLAGRSTGHRAHYLAGRSD
jgi:hypothetical protein